MAQAVTSWSLATLSHPSSDSTSAILTHCCRATQPPLPSCCSTSPPVGSCCIALTSYVHWHPVIPACCLHFGLSAPATAHCELSTSTPALSQHPGCTAASQSWESCAHSRARKRCQVAFLLNHGSINRRHPCTHTLAVPCIYVHAPVCVYTCVYGFIRAYSPSLSR